MEARAARREEMRYAQERNDKSGTKRLQNNDQFDWDLAYRKAVETLRTRRTLHHR